MDVNGPSLDQCSATLPSSAACWVEVEQLLTFRDFAAAPQLRNFLKYIVEETLAQRGDQLKERNIAVHALMRSADFDPRLDSVVRVMAGKLRRALECYYQGREGAAATIRIEVPRGAYRPLFRRIEPANKTQTFAPEVNNATKCPVLAVLPLVPLTEGIAEHALAEALACEICVQLRKWNWLDLVTHWHSELPGATEEDWHCCDYLVGGTCRRQAGIVRVTVQLTNVSDRHILWADQFDMREEAESFTAEDAIVFRICAAISKAVQSTRCIPTSPSDHLIKAYSPTSSRS